MFILYFTAFDNFDFLNLPCGGHSFLMPTRRSNRLETLAKLKEEIFAEENLADFCLMFHDTTHRNFFRKILKKYVLLTKNAEISKENVQKVDMIRKDVFRKMRCFWSTEWFLFDEDLRRERVKIALYIHGSQQTKILGKNEMNVK